MNHYLYCVTVGCPACDEVTQFVATTESEVGLMQDVPLLKSHCPECGVQVDAIDDWDLRAEHEIQTVPAGTAEENIAMYGDRLDAAAKTMRGEADELAAREDVDEHLNDVIEGLRHHADEIEEFLQEEYYR